MVYGFWREKDERIKFRERERNSTRFEARTFKLEREDEKKKVKQRKETEGNHLSASCL